MEIKHTNTKNTWRVSGENIEYNFPINVSKIHNTFLWVWAKTGTSHMVEVLRDFGFDNYGITETGLIFISKGISQIHTCSFFPGHENYKMMVSARNPYSRFFSFYRHSNRGFYENMTIEGFREFLENTIIGYGTHDCVTFSERFPDYYVRVESMFQDYCKIPFIIESDLYKSGNLELLCQKKINYDSDNHFWKDFYNQSLADLVYYGTQEYFRFFGYDKNSWKK